MPIFLWEGTTRSGETKSGEVEAENKNDAEKKVQAKQITISKLKKKPIEIKIPGLGKVPTKSIVIFTRQLATMIDAGLPLVQCLEILSTQEPNKTFKGILVEIKASVERGTTFAEALAKHPKTFDDLFINLIAAGEVGGILDTILGRLAIYIEKNEKLVRKIKGAFTYPIAILVVAILVVIILLWKVIPTFENMFKSFGDAELPGPTQFVIDLSTAFSQHAFLIVGGLVGFVMLMQFLLRVKKSRAVFDAFILKAPIFGPLVRKSAVAKFTRTLGTMVSSGVPILDALHIVAKASGNMKVESGINYVRSRIAEGTNLAQPLAETGVFPSMVVQMISVGEATGALDTMLSKIAEFYEEEVDVAVDSLISLVEPIMMVFIGGIVGGMLIAMYLPIFDIAGKVG